MKLKDRLQNARKKSGLSMSDVAKWTAKIATANREPRLSVTQGYISRLESGQEDNPSMMKIQSLCIVYGIMPNRIVNDEAVKSA